jgi:A/G-specific adenine glycosylase
MTLDRTASWYQSFRRQLIKWYQGNGRELPWRQTSDPYQIWVSEIMLQQTQVATVIDYYHRFLKKFPTVTRLAKADQAEVLALWSGLGYYRRARSLHAAAQQIAQQHDGKFPDSVETIQSLAGVGRYTAGAIASFAFDLRAPILEANTNRLFSRLIGLREQADSTSAQKELWRFAEEILPPKGSGSGEINQAVMELGSVICTPTAPKCSLCPVSSLCQAHRLGLESQIPLMKPKPQTLPLTHVGLIIRNSKSQVLLRQNPVGQWWDGLWDLPWIKLEERPKLSLTDAIRLEIVNEFETQLGLACEITDTATLVRHAVTKYKVRYLCVHADLIGRKIPLGDSWAWFSTNKLPPVASRFRRIGLS